MDDKITFLGVGGDGIITSKQDLGTGGIVLQTEGMQFHIDPGPGTLVRAKQNGINVRETTAILVSHAHLNHCNDINALIAACSYSGMDKQAVLVGSKSLFDGLGEGHGYITQFHKDCVEKVIKVEPGKKIGINKIEIHTTKTEHSDETAIGFRIFTPDYTMVYSGDTAYSKDLVEEYKGADVLILNVKVGFGKTSPGNLSADDVVKLTNEIKPRLVVITHYGMKLLQENPLHVAREIQKQTDVQIIAAKDGMVINPKAYSSGKQQQTLIQYK